MAFTDDNRLMASPAIIVSIAERSVERMIDSSVVPIQRGCWVEFRLDALPTVSGNDLLAACRRLADTSGRVVFTLRTKEQGGASELDLQSRLDFWLRLLDERSTLTDNFDWELDLAEEIRRTASGVPWERVIVSEHRFEPGANGLDHIYHRMAAFPNAISKIVFNPRVGADCAEAFSLFNRARSDHRRIIVIALGPKGAVTRILGPAFGSVATYASRFADAAVAPGQIAFDEIIDRFGVPSIREDYGITGIVANPVGHSISPVLHNAIYRKLGLRWVYVPFEVDDLALFIRRLVRAEEREVQWQLKGLSVTIPHKVAAMSLVDRTDELAKRVGALNTISVVEDRLEGFNTDVAGIIEPLRKRIDCRGKLAMILGAGGAAAAAAVALQDAGAYVRILSRNRQRARDLAKRLQLESGEIADLLGENYDILINATPVGMTGFPDQRFDPEFQPSPCTVVFDLVYNPIETPLLALARSCGCQTISGLEMLVEQAALQHEIWTGEPADRTTMMRVGSQALSPE